MKILFGGVHLDHEVDRLGGTGLAAANTRYFRNAGHGPKPLTYSIELDTDTGLVTITAGHGGAIVVPRERVLRFEPLPASALPVDAEAEVKRGPGRPRKDAVA
jgi:hypothetical protein